MQKKKERSDDAVLSLERIGREIREAKTINSTGTNILKFEKKITSSTDTNTFIRYVRNTSTNRLMRQSATTLAGLPSDSTSGNIVADQMLPSSALVPILQIMVVVSMQLPYDLTFADGSAWNTKVFPMNYGL